jgi:ribosomal protein S18 acetylase RimI-like enzyme
LVQRTGICWLKTGRAFARRDNSTVTIVYMDDQEPVGGNAEAAAEVEVRRIADVAAIKEAESLFDKSIDHESAERFITSDGHHLLLAYEGRKPVGMVTGVELTHPDKGTEMFLYELGVDDAHRGRGIGTRLVRELAELARQRRCNGMWVLTEKDNRAAQAVYEHAGGRREDDETMYSWEFQP